MKIESHVSSDVYTGRPKSRANLLTKRPNPLLVRRNLQSVIVVCLIIKASSHQSRELFR
jgi:hypothetical protein